MNQPTQASLANAGFDESQPCSKLWRCWEAWLILLVFVIFAGDPTPGINEAHYLAKAKQFWQPDWCANDLFVTSGKAHTTFYWTFGWWTRFVSLDAAAWIGRLIGWSMLAIGWQRLCWAIAPKRYVSPLAACIWIVGIQYGNLAGEWVVGGIEAKVPAYAFVLFALERMVCRRWSWVWPLLGAASAFHVLVGGWSVLAAGLVWIASGKRRGSLVRQLLPLAIGGGLALFGLLPALWLSAGTAPEDAVAAARTYVYERIPHHLLPADFPAHWYIRHGVLILLTAAIVAIQPIGKRLQDLTLFTIGAVLLAGIGLVIGMLPESHPDLAAKLLRYYWFRLTDAAVPLLLAIATVRLFVVDCRWGKKCGWAIAIPLSVASVACIAWLGIERQQVNLPASCDRAAQGHAQETSMAERQEVFQEWKRVCQWIQENTDPDAVFLTPRHQQTFKWYAERAEVVNFKDVPQDVPNLKIWQTRFDDVFPPELGRFRVTIQYSELLRYREQYGAKYMVVDRRAVPYRLPLQSLYPTPLTKNKYYAVYQLP
ncbi:hypothetical protein FF011L_07180 [Roseimaritima multifibrata]|uniref:DUF6798 domain-containing protein n=1 Tax=Roseimaritima multifibrata TaxID=1930274 RepID=A0A517MAS2_9BACT|nr:DUF6798 domain-containing protein [Roseimaritima multifibrata]QDS91982.1 hypothetical protein FF011L_07180 [Roseimaritima multifibrata]